MNVQIMTADKGVKLDFAARMLKFYMDNDTPVMIWGAPGVGKSDVVAQDVAERRQKNPKYGFIDQRIALLDPVDLNGLPMPDLATGTARWLAPDWLPRVDRDGEFGTLFLDEVNAGTVGAMAALYQLVLNRKLGAYSLPAGWRIVAAGNRQSDRAAAQKMPTALANRFGHIDVVVDVDVWCSWAVANNVDPAMIAFIKFRPQLLHIMPGATISDVKEGLNLTLPVDARAFPTPRSITDAAKYISAPDDVRLELIAGRCGIGFATEFNGFFATFLALPSVAQILADPMGAKVPSGPGALFAVAAAIARKATMQNYPAILAYAERLPKSYEVLSAFDSQNRDKTLAQTGAWVSWCGKNAGVFA